MPLRLDGNSALNATGASAGTAGKVTMLNATNFNAAIANTPGPIAVEFMNFACSHCIAAQPMLEDVAKALGNKVTVFQVELHQSPELFQRFRISGTPEFVMFENGAKKSQGNLSAITPFAIRQLITAPFQG